MEVKKSKIWRLKRSDIEKIISEEFTNLRWCSAEEGSYTYRVKLGVYRSEKIGGVLYARPKDYTGKIEDYEIPIVKEIKSNDWQKILGYRWVD
jgi:hypothetical protein